MNISVIIPAAGVGDRLGSIIPKQYLMIDGQTILQHTVEKFLSNPLICKVVIAINQNHRHLYDKLFKNYDTRIITIIGGETRVETVFNALTTLDSDDQLQPTHVLIHDAVRPFVSKGLIEKIIDSLDSCNATMPAININDTIKSISNNIVSKTLDREEVYRIQTPQGFLYQDIFNSYKKILDLPNRDFKDDSSILEFNGFKVNIIVGELLNFKITTAEDYDYAKSLCNIHKNQDKSLNIRTGFGFDAHKFSLEDKGDQNMIKLGGVDIQYNFPILAHSDGDLVLHALVDAILGSMALGDIGEFFPSSDEIYKNYDSTHFLYKSLELLHIEGFAINNVDITVVCEKPNLSCYKSIMQKHLAHIMQLDTSQVAIKASTVDKLGSIGRKEGIICFVNILVHKV